MHSYLKPQISDFFSQKTSKSLTAIPRKATFSSAFTINIWQPGSTWTAKELTAITRLLSYIKAVGLKKKKVAGGRGE